MAGDIAASDAAARVAGAGRAAGAPAEAQAEADAVAHAAEFAAEHQRTLRPAYGTYRVSPSARRPDDTKPRRPFLLASPASERRPGTLVYGSSVEDEPLGIGIAGHPVAPRYGPPGRRLSGNGLDVETTFYPHLLLFGWPDQLTRQLGTMTDAEHTPVRRALRRALGIGTKGRNEPGAKAGSWRGEVVLLTEDAAERLAFDYGLVVTDHETSARGRVQLLIPLVLDRPEFRDPDDDVRTQGAWVKLLGGDVTAGKWAVPFACTIDQEYEPLARVGHLVGTDDLAAVDAVLVRRFDLGRV